MNVDIEEYDRVNYGHIRDANTLIDVIADDIGYDHNLVIDIGCGSGNVTSLMDKRLNCKRIVALDIDMKSIRFAERKHPSLCIDYLVQDISCDWQSLHPVVRECQGKADFVFSNRCLHWIDNKDQAFQNIRRLLKPNGKLYANVTTLYDLSSILNVDGGQQVAPTSTSAEQVEQYKRLLECNEFRAIKVENWKLSQIFEHDDFKSVHLSYFPSLTRHILRASSHPRRNSLLGAKFDDLVRNAFLRHYCNQLPSHDPDKPDFELLYEQIRIVANK